MKYNISNLQLTLLLILLSVSGICQQKQFQLLSPKETGISFSNTIKDDNEKNILIYSNFYGGGGVGIGDFNNDGLQDIYFAGNIVDDCLYINKGEFKFIDYTKKANIISDGSWSTGVTVADVNNDGLQDIYISKELYDNEPKKRRNQLYINQGNAVFKEMAVEFGVANTKRTRHAVFFDYNKDGFLDLFLLNQPPNPGSYSEYSGAELLRDEYAPTLYKNLEGKKFIDVTKEANLLKPGFPNAVSASDFNNDGYTDLYITNDFYAPDFLYINNQDGTFTEIAKSALNHMSYYSMGIDVADINNDGFLDVLVLDMVAEDNFRLKSNMSGMNPDVFWKVVKDGGHYQYMFNNFHLNNGNNTFSDIAQIANMAATDWSWSNLIADFDNDGKKDIFITNGLLHDIRNTDADKEVAKYINDTRVAFLKNNPNGGNIKTIFDIIDLKEIAKIMPTQPLKNYMFKNNGGLNFTKVADEWGLTQETFSNGAAYADLDNDGDLDLIINNINENAYIYKNNTSANYLRIALKSKNNLPIFGSRVELYNENQKQVAETTNVRGIYSTSEPYVHFGLADKATIDSISVTWPNGKITKLKNINANQQLELFLEDALVTTIKDQKKVKKLFTEITDTNIISFKHKENDFDDYAYQVLLPHKMSQFGPALAVGDVNGDGLEDVFCGAANGSISRLFIQTSSGTFAEPKPGLFSKDIEFEDVDAEFLDIDNDDDLDLYIVSGGNEFDPDSDHYKDRIYTNDGKGNFTKVQMNDLPVSSGSVMREADFDKDGDLDIFVGGRHKPHFYPEPVSSNILLNDNGIFTEATKEIAPGLLELGMVTDALWTDFDNDGDLDLVVVGEWMPVTFFENENGKLIKMENQPYKDLNGWWYSIEQGDFDNDGDFDYVLGNLGLNYKYKASKEEPFDVFYDDFDKNGSNDIVLGYYNFGKHFPLRGFSCSSQQIPQLKEEFKKYDIFADLQIDEVYGKKNLQKSLHLEAYTFASTYLENLGNGKFKATALPYQTQLSNMNDMLVDDINNDGNLDIISVYNLFVSEIETSRNDAGIGTVLIGNGDNTFKIVPYGESDFFDNKDAKKIKLLHLLKSKSILVSNNNDILQIFRLED